MNRELSVSYTWLYRWAIPAWLTAGAVVAVWWGALGGPDEGTDLLRAASGFSLAVILVLVARIFDRAKRIWLEDGCIRVSDFNQEVIVKAADIKRVTVLPLFWPCRVRLELRNTTVFGDAVMFFPPLSLGGSRQAAENIRRQIEGSIFS